MHHIAEINVARAIAPLDDPLMAEFVAQLDAVNAVADASPGFVWRLVADGGGASSYLSVFPDPRMIVNISVWRSPDALKEYVYRTHAHAEVFRSRGQWFERPTTPVLALWWVREGTIPAVEDAVSRLESLRVNGPTPQAFTFKAMFPPPLDAASDRDTGAVLTSSSE